MKKKKKKKKKEAAAAIPYLSVNKCSSNPKIRSPLLKADWNRNLISRALY